ncbi:MAG: dockerin type I repeat-containing protein [Ruminococcus sp.]|nr:dockerin type I repeat-containing protein [Ruminococcus sp.]
MKKRLLSLLLCMALLVGLIPASAATAFAAETPQSASLGKGADDLAATGDYDYTDPDNPYMATDLNSLKAVFEQERPKGTTIYIELAKDIFSTIDTDTSRAILTTNGADVVLDLAGYTMGITSENSISLVNGAIGKVTIEDSRRYDSSKKQWVDGRLEFECKTHLIAYWDTAVLLGEIIIKGGIIKNNNHSSERLDFVYSGKNIEVYGGTLEADYPIYLTRLGSLKCVIHDGTLRVKRDVAIISSEGSILPNRHPVIERCVIENASGNEKVAAFNLNLEKDFAENHTASDAFATWNSIVSPDTYAFINGTKQPKGSYGILYNGVGALTGPLFRDSYVITPLDTVKTLQLSITDPQAGNSIIYHASAPSRSPYQVEDYDDDNYGWKDGVQWGYYDYVDSNLAHIYHGEGMINFRPGVKYGIWVRVGLKDKYLAQFADPEELSATINGNAAKVTENLDGTLTVSCDFVVSNVVNFVQVLVPEPAAGEAIPYSASVPTYAQEQYEVPALSSGTYQNGVLWSKNGAPLQPSSAGVFEYGNKYTAYILVKPTPDYVFPEPDELTAVINNRVAERVVNYGEYGYAFVYTFDLTNLVGSVDLTIPEPRAGAQLEWTASAPEGADYTVADNSSGFMANGVMWYKGTTVITPGKKRQFEAMETYKVTIRIKAANGHVFSGEDMPVTVNGNPAGVSGVYSETDYLISYTFTAKNLIDRLDITIPTPIKGGPITYKSTTPDECGFELSDYTFDSDDEYWRNGMSWWENGVRLQANKSYYFTAAKEYDVYIAVNPTWEPQFKYADTSDMTVTVNGNPATIERATSCYLISYTFTIPAETTGYILGDVDSDGSVTVIDATCIQRHLTTIPTFAYHENAADTDGDGEVTILDATFIQRWLANMSANNKIGQPI